MRLLGLSILGSSLFYLSSAQFTQADMERDQETFGMKSAAHREEKSNLDGAEYDDQGNRVHRRRVQSYRPEHQNYQQENQENQENLEYGTPQKRMRRQNQGYKIQKSSAPRLLRPVAGSNRPLRPVEKQEAPVYVPQGRQGEYNQPPRRPLRPVVEEPTYQTYQDKSQEEFAYPEIKRSDFAAPETQRFAQPAPERVQQPAPERAQAQRTPDFASDRIYTEPAQTKRNAQNDLLEGESFQPAYTPYSAPAGAYNEGYAPPEQKNLEEAVAAGAAAYNGDTYEDPQRLSFQIHGQDGPNSYRFGYDTGIGYNRQFRYEERDNAGVLHGRYGYYDQEGKLQVVNYTADPHSGFHAEGEHVPKPQY